MIDAEVWEVWLNGCLAGVVVVVVGSVMPTVWSQP